jgi:hypothetical protein
VKQNRRWGDGPPRTSARAKPGSWLDGLGRMASAIRSILQEIFDESAYQRFLERNGLQSSPSAYARFRQENEQAKSRRPKCC